MQGCNCERDYAIGELYARQALAAMQAVHLTELAEPQETAETFERAH